MRIKPAAHRLGLLAAVALVAGGPAARAGVVKPGESAGPLGLGLTSGEAPEILKKAKADPYAAPPAPACESIPKEIAALDEVLGPDADAPPDKSSANPGQLLGAAVRTIIPHREIIRFITGAGRKEKSRNEAAMAGWSRRGYLKGMAVNLGCAEREAGAPPPPAVAAAPAGAAETPAYPAALRDPARSPAVPPAAAAAPAALPPIPPGDAPVVAGAVALDGAAGDQSLAR